MAWYLTLALRGGGVGVRTGGTGEGEAGAVRPPLSPLTLLQDNHQKTDTYKTLCLSLNLRHPGFNDGIHKYVNNCSKSCAVS